MAQDREKEQLLSTVESEEIQKIIANDLRDIDKDALTPSGKISGYQITDVESNPMGGIIVYLVINNNPKYKKSIFININPITDNLESTGGSYTEELYEFLTGEE